MVRPMERCCGEVSNMGVDIGWKAAATAAVQVSRKVFNRYGNWGRRSFEQTTDWQREDRPSSHEHRDDALFHVGLSYLP